MTASNRDHKYEHVLGNKMTTVIINNLTSAAHLLHSYLLRIVALNLTSVSLILKERKFAKYEFRNVKMWLLRPNFAELEL